MVTRWKRSNFKISVDKLCAWFACFDLNYCVCEVGTVGKISDYQPEDPGFSPRPGRGLNIGDLLPHTVRGQGR